MDYFHTFSIYTEGVVFQFKVRLEWRHSIPIRKLKLLLLVFSMMILLICKTDLLKPFVIFIIKNRT
jgi:hypothetical protein